jgi:hypothetical protein
MAWYLASPATLSHAPYQWRLSSTPPVMFFWQPLKHIRYRHAELEQFYWGMAAFGRARYPALQGSFWPTSPRSTSSHNSLSGRGVTVLAPCRSRATAERAVSALSGRRRSSQLPHYPFQVHYTAPAAIFVVLSSSSLRAFWLMQHRLTIGATAVRRSAPIALVPRRPATP